MTEFDWYHVKLFVAHTTTLGMDALHVILGVLLLLVAAAALRMPLTRWWPWLIVLVLALLNELNDFRVELWPDLGMQLGEAAKDVLLTMLLPTVLLAVGRLKPRLLR